MIKNLRDIKKVTAFAALFTFSINTITGFSMGAMPTHAAGGMSGLASTESHGLDLSSVRAIPEQAGSIGTIYSAPSTRAVVYHVQDAHTSLEAQRNIKKILEYLTRDSKIDTIFLEGALEEVHGDWMRFFQDDKLNAKAAKLLLREGLIGGAELFLLDHDRANKNLRVLGVEDREIYLKNLAAYQAVLSRKNDADHFLTGLQSQIVTAGSRIFNKELGAFFKEWVIQTETLEEPFRHFKTLEKAAQENLGMRWDNPRSQIDWPQFYRLVQLNELEKTSDLRQAVKECGILSDWLTENKAPKSLRGKISQMAEVLNSGEWPSDNPREDIEIMDAALRPLGFSFKSYPALSNMLGRIILRSELDAQLLMNESSLMRDQLLEKLSFNATEKKLIRIYKDYLLLKALLRLELSAENYAEVMSRGSFAMPASLASDIAILGDKEKSLKIPNSMDIQELAMQALMFYKIAHSRDQVISDHMLKKMKSLGEHNAILITGGFHSAGLHELWKKSGVSFVEVTPHLSEIKKHSGYENTLLMKGNMKTRLTTVNHPSFGEGPVTLNRLPRYGSYMQAMGLHVRRSIASSLPRALAKNEISSSPRSRRLEAYRSLLSAKSEVRSQDVTDEVFASGLYDLELTMIPPKILSSIAARNSVSRRKLQADKGYLVVPAQVEVLDSIIALSGEPITETATLDAVFKGMADTAASDVLDPISAITLMTPEEMRLAVESSHGFGEGSVIAAGFTATTREAVGITYDGVIVDYTLTSPSIGSIRAKATLIYKDGNLVTIADFVTLDRIAPPVVTTPAEQATLPLSVLTSSNYALATGNYHDHYAIYVGTQSQTASAVVSVSSPETVEVLPGLTAQTAPDGSFIVEHKLERITPASNTTQPAQPYLQSTLIFTFGDGTQKSLLVAKKQRGLQDFSISANSRKVFIVGQTRGNNILEEISVDSIDGWQQYASPVPLASDLVRGTTIEFLHDHLGFAKISKFRGGEFLVDLNTLVVTSLSPTVEILPGLAAQTAPDGSFSLEHKLEKITPAFNPLVDIQPVQPYLQSTLVFNFSDGTQKSVKVASHESQLFDFTISQDSQKVFISGQQRSNRFIQEILLTDVDHWTGALSNVALPNELEGYTHFVFIHSQPGIAEVSKDTPLGEVVYRLDLSTMQAVRIPSANEVLEEVKSPDARFIVQRLSDALVLLNKTGREINRIDGTGTTEYLTASDSRFYWVSRVNGLPVVHSMSYSAEAAVKDYKIPQKLVNYGIQLTAYSPETPLVLYVKPANRNWFKIAYSTTKAPTYKDMGKKGIPPASYLQRSEVRLVLAESVLNTARIAGYSISENVRRNNLADFLTAVGVLAREVMGEVSDSPKLLQILDLMRVSLEGVLPTPKQGTERRGFLYLDEINAAELNEDSAYALMLLALAPRMSSGARQTNEVVLYVRGESAAAARQRDLVAKVYSDIIKKIAQPDLANNLILVNAASWSESQIRKDMVKRTGSQHGDKREKAILSSNPKFLAALAAAEGSLRINRARVSHNQALIGSETLLKGVDIDEHTHDILNMKDLLERLGLSSLLAAKMAQLLAAIKIAVSA